MRITGEHSSAFRQRFYNFYDGVIVGVDIRAPRGKLSTVRLEIQAMDATRPVPNPRAGQQGVEWRLVRLTVHGVNEYRFLESRQYSYRVLSDGLAVAASPTEFVLDLDPGPDDWDSSQVHREGGYSKQYVIGERGDYEVSDIP